MSRQEEDAIESNWKNTDEAFVLLDLIAAEFQSDPLSTQCFDERIVERVKLCAAKRRDYVAKSRNFIPLV